MKSLQQFVQEKLKVSNKKSYTYKPANSKELRELVKKRVEEEGPQVDLNDIDVSDIKDFSRVFRNKNGMYTDFNGDVSRWDVSNAQIMTEMFYGCSNFNGDLSDWDVSNVLSMSIMFAGCEKFEGTGLDNWDVSNVENMFCAFSDCRKFNADISQWDVNEVHNFNEMFDNCLSFNRNLDDWNIRKHASMESMFNDCKKLKLPKWYK